jgi:hypothetical protein
MPLCAAGWEIPGPRGQAGEEARVRCTELRAGSSRQGQVQQGRESSPPEGPVGNCSYLSWRSLALVGAVSGDVGVRVLLVLSTASCM